MEQEIPVYAASVDLSLKHMQAVAVEVSNLPREEAWAKWNSIFTIEGYVRPRSGARQAKAHKLRALHDSDGGLVCYQRRRAALHHGPHSAKREVDPEQTWQKTPSGPVDTMQLKTGRKGRTIPASHRSGPQGNEQRGGVAVAHA